ncbi:response regulator transcription factor [Leptolinea tardivitalis]|uniref:response regulator transcription factor n=1 Tax=Leptolinea tardivitalis TaxID=229920 RepID=UPI0007838317|nr:response regulator transcription factor [Leptolinea tardivitalis]GAP23062.1 two component transcriptional regulator, LuxR family [Leptolinea tardivitalis]
MINILVSDSFYLSRSGLVSILSRQADFNIICLTLDCSQLRGDIQQYHPDVVVLDMQQCLDEMQKVISEHCENHTKFLLLAKDPLNPTSIIRLLRAGAHGCIQVNMGEDYLVQSIRDVASNKSPLSPTVVAELLAYIRKLDEPVTGLSSETPELSKRENLILNLLYEGLPNKIIGSHLGISERTVEAHVRNILRKLNATSRTQAVFIASKNGWLKNTN